VVIRLFTLAILALAWWKAVHPLRKGYVFYTSLKGSKVERKSDPMLFWPLTLFGIAFALFVVDVWLR
jgi:hypothetical protein